MHASAAPFTNFSAGRSLSDAGFAAGMGEGSYDVPVILSRAA